MTDTWVPHERGTWPWRIATLKEDVTFRKWQGHNAQIEFIDVVWPAGTTVKIVMVSRFGDVGITDDLSAEYGYHARVKLDILQPCCKANGAKT